MKTNKIYQSKNETETKLDECIRNLVSGGIRILPSERDLCEITGGSRKVLRELIEELTERGRLVLKKRKREIVIPESSGKMISVLFVAIGNYHVETYSWAQLWHYLQKEAEISNIDLQLVLIPSSEQKRKDAIRFLKHSDAKYLILPDVKNILKHDRFDFKKHICIFTDENDTQSEENVISLDNLELGKMAARALYQAGYRRPAIISKRFYPDYLPFVLRTRGVIEECGKLGIALRKKDCLTIDCKSTRNMMISTLDHAEHLAQTNEYDSIFIITDEELLLINSILYEYGVNHERFGLISMDGSGVYERFFYPLPVLTSASEEIARKILQSVCDMEKGGKIGHIRCTPTLLNGEFLHPEMKDQEGKKLYFRHQYKTTKRRKDV